jgi:VanZ family protein
MSTSVRVIATAVYMLLLLVLSLTPGHAQPGDTGFSWLIQATPKLLQKSMHVVCYAGLAALCMWTLQPHVRHKASLYALSLLIPLVYGGGLEWGQTAVPGRFANIMDLLLNGLGALIGFVLAAFVLTRVVKRIE